MKKYLKLILSVAVVLAIVGAMTVSNAAKVTESSLEEFLKNNTSIDFENTKDSDIITLVEELTSKYTTQDLAEIIDQYSDELVEAGVEKESLDTATEYLRNINTNDLRNFIEDINLDEVKEKIDNGEDIQDIVTEYVEEQSPLGLVGLAIKFLFTNTLFKVSFITSLIVGLVFGIYQIIVRWIIYKKAGKHGWAAIIPIYKDVVWLKIAGLSPWLLLLFLIPIFGWIALSIIFIVSKFKLPVEFGQSALWGLGLWFVPIIFESVIAFSNNFKYHEETNQNETVEATE